MPEVSAQDLRRFRRLEERLAAAEEKRRAVTAERSDAVRDLRRAETEAAKEESRVEELLAENKRLAELLASTKADLDDAAEAQSGTAAALGTMTRERDAWRGHAIQGRDQLRTARSRIEQLEAQLEDVEDDGVSAPLTAESVAVLLDDFVGRLDGRMSGLRLDGGELKLRVGFAATSTGAAFVVPSASRRAEDVEALHEVRLSLDASPLRDRDEGLTFDVDDPVDGPPLD